MHEMTPEVLRRPVFGPSDTPVVVRNQVESILALQSVPTSGRKAVKNSFGCVVPNARLVDNHPITNTTDAVDMAGAVEQSNEKKKRKRDGSDVGED